jgi:phage-related baseplate assembly protein
MATDPFLAGLPDPTVIEEVDFTSILADMETDIIGRYPPVAPVLALESSATKKNLETVSYRETIIRARVNDAARANLVAFAEKGDLDHVGANASPPVQRMAGEGDERFRVRILLAVRSRNVGSVYRYRFVALSTSLLVKDAIAYRVGRDPTVYVALLSTAPDGVAEPSLIAQVQAQFDIDENRLLNSPVVVVSAVSSVVNIVAALTLIPGTPTTIIANAEAALRAAWAIEGGLGRDMTRQWIASRLQVAGVYSVNVTSPAEDVIKPSEKAASIGTVTLTVVGENT